MELHGEAAAQMPQPPSDAQQWLAAFHAGQRSTLEACYRAHLPVVKQAVGQFLQGADRETVVHEVFFKLLADEEVRRSFREGTFGAWLATVARNQARAFIQKYRKERLVEPEVLAGLAGGHTDGHEARVELRELIEAFRQRLPDKWAPVFEARFIRRLDQRTAAAELGIRRTTLAYRELVIRRRLRHFLLREEEP